MPESSVVDPDPVNSKIVGSWIRDRHSVGSGARFRPCLFMKDLKKVQHFIIFISIDLLPVLQHIFPVATTMFRYGAGSGSITNWPSGSVSVI